MEGDLDLFRLKNMENLLFFIRASIHDINNFLTIGTGNLEILKMMLANDNNLFRLEKLDEVILRIRDYLYRIHMFFPSYQKKILSPMDVLRQAINKVLKVYKVNYSLEIEDAPSFICDKESIILALENILLNAAESMDLKKNVSIRCVMVDEANDHCFEAGDTKWMKIEIHDMGCGIDDKMVSKIFEPGFSTKKGRQGLGLTVAKKIVEKHDGFISVASKIGKGSIFSIYLPLMEQV